MDVTGVQMDEGDVTGVQIYAGTLSMVRNVIENE